MGNSRDKMSELKYNQQPDKEQNEYEDILETKKNQSADDTILVEEAKKTGKLIEHLGEYKYNHQVDQVQIDCPHLIKLSTVNASSCPIYHAMKEQYQFTEENLSHLHQYSHF